MRTLFTTLCLALATSAFAGEPAAPEAPKPQKFLAPRGNEWLGAIERLRLAPRPGEIVHGNANVHIADIYEMTPEQKEAAKALAKQYEEALALKAAAWEKEQETLRAEYEAKLIAALPEGKRESTKKVLDYSHAQWVPPFERMAMLKEQSVLQRAKVKGAGSAGGDELREANATFRKWMQEERQRALKQEETVVTTIKSMLTLDEIARFDALNPARIIPAQQRPAPK